MKNIVLMISAAMTICIACTKQENPENNLPEQTKEDFYAYVEGIDGTKTSSDSDYRITWSEKDCLSIFEGSTIPDKYTLADDAAGTKSCRFEYTASGSGGFGSGMELGHTIAYYPYSENVSCLSGIGSGTYLLEVSLPETQIYSPGSVGNNALPMAAVAEKEIRDLMFNHICGVLKLQIKGNTSVKTIRLNGHSNERLSGEASVTVDSDGSMPSLEMKEEASQYVTLDCGEGVELNTSEATDFLIVVPPVSFKSGFTITITDTKGNSLEFNTYEKNPIGRAEVLKMPAITFENGASPDVVPPISDPGIAYMWDESVIPEITISITEEEWNNLLFRYDEFSHNVDYFHADFTYKKGSEVTQISDGGLRLRGNTSRRRPEGNYGESHNSSNPDWHHCHFGINFRKFHKDSDHTINGIRKVNLKWFKDDPNYVRELYCYDLFRRYGIWTAAFDVYCRVWLKVGDEDPAYLGVFEMIEPVDDEFIERRLPNMFENHKGNLWKCGGGDADLNGLDGSWSIDLDNGINYTYEYKGDEEDYAGAKAQLEDFILKLQGKGEESFYKWIKEVCDVEFLLKTYAVNVVVGMCDDYWNNGNNFYIYFNTSDKFEYKFFLIPYDYDNTLGTSWNIGKMNDPGRQDPYDWGDRGLLMERLMKFDEFRQIYKKALQELVAEENGLFHVDASIARIQAWQNKIKDYVSNDTGEDMYIYDDAASWGDLQGYLLMTKGYNNFFQVKTETVNNME